MLKLFRASEVQTPLPSPPSGEPFAWIEAMFPKGKVIEICGGACSASSTLALEALSLGQQEGLPVAWIQRGEGAPFAPDMVESGLSLEALIFIRAREDAPPRSLLFAAEELLKSASLGTLVLDWRSMPSPRGSAWIRRIQAALRASPARFLLLVDRARPYAPYSALVDLRLGTHRRLPKRGLSAIDIQTLKSRVHGNKAIPPLFYRAPDGCQ